MSNSQLQIKEEKNTNFLTNPFDGLSVNECLEEVHEILASPDIELDELEVRRLQLEETQPGAYALAEKQNLIEKWKGMELLLS